MLGTILLAHGAVIAVIAAGRSSDRPASPESRLVSFDIAAPHPKVAPPQPAAVPPSPMPVPAAALPIAISVPQPVSIAAGAEAGTGGCDLTETVQAALRASPRARAAIASLPIGSRSVANAVMLWDGRWVVAGGPQAQGALGLIRREIAAVVADATPECRVQEQAGPRLIVVPGTPDVTLALGSGRWRWGELDDGMAPKPIALASADQRRMPEINDAAVGPAASGGAPAPYLNISFILHSAIQGERR